MIKKFDEFISEGAMTNTLRRFHTGVQRKEDVEPVIDLGLSVKWASFNLGAKSPYEYGKYFAWGEHKGYYENENVTFDIKNNKLGMDLIKEFLSDVENLDNCYSTKKEPEMSHNRTYAIVNGNLDTNLTDNGTWWRWKIPSIEDYKELISNTEQTYVKINNISGVKFTAKNGNWIFLPSAGWRDYKVPEDDEPKNVYNQNWTGHYWTSNFSTDEPDEDDDDEKRYYAYNLSFSNFNNKLYIDEDDYSYSYQGMPIRLICK